MKRCIPLFVGGLVCLSIVAAALEVRADQERDTPKVEPAPDPQPEQPQPAQPFRIQIGPGGFMPLQVGNYGAAMGDPLQILRLPKVQDELKLADEQKKAVADGLEKITAAQSEAWGGLRGVAREDMAKKREEAQKKIAAATEEIRERITKTLDKDQNARLEQLAVQRRGIGAVTDDDLAKKLDLSDDQKKEIQDLKTDLQQKSRQVYQDVQAGNLDRGKMQEKMEELRKETDEGIEKSLTEEQRAEYAKMTGEKFDFGLPAMRGGAVFQAIPLQAVPGQIRRIRVQPQPQPDAPEAPREEGK